jgi:hypothetical protein
MYKNIRELSADERPSDEVMEDDTKLDAFLMDLERKRASR